MVVTGASGLLGRHLLQALGDRYYIHAMARRSPREVGIELRPNIRWVPVDVGEEASVRGALDSIRQWGGADYVVHLAGYYDFTYADHPEYERTNVQGTRHLLAHLASLRPKHLIYSSSLTVHDFNAGESRIDEQRRPDATFPYAVSKAKAEDLVREQSDRYRCSIVRLAAIYTDWCEYEPLFHFLTTWLAPGLMSRVLGGRGESAIPYLHVDDFTAMVLRLIERTDYLPRCGVYFASPDGCTPHHEMYAIANRYSFGEHRAPIHMPWIACLLGILARVAWGRISGHEPFERTWMLRYLDRVLPVDASRTRRLLGWAPTPRLQVGRRLLFLIENMKSQPYEWRRRNEEAAHRSPPERLNFRIYERLIESREGILGDVESTLGRALAASAAAGSGALDADRLRQGLELLFRGLEIAIRIGDRKHILSYARQLVDRRNPRGAFPQQLMGDVLHTMARVTEDTLLRHPALDGLGSRIHDVVTLTFQLVGDEVEDALARVDDPERAAAAGGA